MHKIQNDVPIENSEDDCLGRTLFANSIASIIYDLKESDIKEQGIVFGLSGQWGSGKTSLINLIKNTLIGQMIKAIKEWANNDLCNKDDSKKPYKGRLIEHRDARYLLQYWQQNENGNDLKNYVSNMTQTNSGLLKFIDKLKSKTKTSDGTDYKVKCHIYGYDLKPFFNDLETLKKRLINIDRNLLKDEEITILDMILKDIDNRERLR